MTIATRVRTSLCRPYLLQGLVTVALISQATVSAATAQQFDAKLFEGLRWRSIGPARGGRALAVTGVRGKPELYYFGAVGGGVWQTNDAGRTWKPIFDSQPVASIGAIAVAPSNSDVIYVGSGEADMRSSISLGNGVYKSIDGGKTWRHIGLADSRHIGRLLVDPQDPNRVFVAALGHAYGPNSERGVYRSQDGGQTWERILFKDENTGAIDLAFEPGSPDTIYAALWQTRRPPWSVYPPSNGPGSGLYRSRDGGNHWEQVSGRGLPSEGLGRIGIAFAPSDPQRIYLIVDAKDGGVYRSDNGGENWQRLSHDPRIWQRGWYFGELSVDPKNRDVVYVMNTSAYKSEDGGATFHTWRGAPGGDDYHELWIDPDQPSRMILSSDQGALVTRNGGETWSSWFNQPTGQFYHVITDDRFPYWIYGAQQDSNALAMPSRSNYRALNFHDWRPINAGDENGYIAPDPLNAGVIYGGFVTRQDLANEQTEEMPPTLAHPGDFRRTWTLPLLFSSLNPHVLYFGSQTLFRTADGGNSWQTISPDLTREDPGVPGNLDADTAADVPKTGARGVIYTIASSYLRTGQIWAGTDDGLIQLTEDEGKTWKNITPPELTAWGKVTHIEASHFDEKSAYAAIDRHRLEDLKPYLYRTHDLGKTWTLSARGIPEGSFLNCIREDPARKGLLYACTETGVYVSFDDGDNWQPLRLNLPVTSVRDLVVHKDDLVIATFGRAFWILDDIAPLRQLGSQMARSDAWLLRPATAFRVRPGTDQGTPVPMDESLADNPPDGAVLDYYLKEKSSSPIRLEIVDSQGQLVRRFASDDKLERTNPDSVPLTMSWVRDPQPLSVEAGMHRFVWDLHYPLPGGMRRSYALSTGIWATPGEYTARLIVNDKTSAQPLLIKMDPRVNIRPEALQKQAALASKLMSKLGEISAALQSASHVRTQIEERSKAATGNAEILNALKSLNARLEAVEPESDADLMLFGLALPRKEPEPLPRVAAALTGLLVVLESADRAPTADVTKAAEAWNESAARTLSRWRNLVEQELATANSLLQKANQPALVLR